MKLRRCVRMVEDRGDQIAGVNAAKVRGSNERSPARSADIDLERLPSCRRRPGLLARHYAEAGLIENAAPPSSDQN